MAYCTLAQLTERYSERMLVDLSNREDAVATEPDVALFDRVIADAGALIDGYLKRRYALPLAATPDLVRDLALRISIHYAHAHVAAPKIKEDYEQALKTLRDIAAGLIVLDIEGGEPAPSGASEVRTNEPERPLSAATMKGYI